MHSRHEIRPGHEDAGHADDTEDDRLNQQVEPQQAGDRGAQRTNGDEGRKEGDGHDFHDREDDRHDHPEPERRHSRHILRLTFDRWVRFHPGWPVASRRPRFWGYAASARNRPRARRSTATGTMPAPWMTSSTRVIFACSRPAGKSMPITDMAASQSGQVVALTASVGSQAR